MFSPRHVLLEAQIHSGSYVADFGCGSGAFVYEAARLVGAQGKVFAIDVQKDLLTRVADECKQSRYANVDTIWGDIETPNGSRLADASVDAVILANVLFQASSRSGMITEAVRITKPGGKIIIIDWHPRSDTAPSFGPQHADIVRQEEIATIMQSSGCVKEKDINVGERHHAGVYRTPAARS